MLLYSAEWVAAFNDAVAGIDVPADASFRMLQLVDGPHGPRRVGLAASEGRVQMTVDPPDEPAPQVTVSVSSEDAAALARGELDPARLLAAGRVKVRGDLSVLVRAQAVLVEAAGRLGPLSEGTAG